MKSFKKALAVMLSVLMVVLSFPFSAMALENPNMGDGKNYSTDTDVVVRIYAMPYVGKGLFGPMANVVDESTGGYMPTKTYDFTNITKAELDADKAAAEVKSKKTNSTFCLVFTVEGLDAGYDSGILNFDYDPTVIQPAFYSANSTSATAYKTLSAAAAQGALIDFTNWDAKGVMDNTGMSHYDNDKPHIYIPCVFNGAAWNATTTWDDDNATEMQGQVVAAFGFELLQDSADLSQIITIDQR